MTPHALALCLVAAALAALGCDPRRPDPPPPASSVALPAAPPGATGAHAAGISPLPTATSFPDPYSDDDGEPLDPELTDPEDPPVLPEPLTPAPEPDAGGVTL